MKITEVTNLQDAVHFVYGYVRLKNPENRLTTPILRTFFAEYIPNYPYICDALTRSSGRPPKSAWTKQQAIDFAKTIESNLNSFGVEEWLLYGLLMRYQKLPEPTIEKNMARLVAVTMRRRNCTAAAAAQYIERNWQPGESGKGVNAELLLIQHQRYCAKIQKNLNL